MKIMHEMDVSGDGRVGFREFDAWWVENGDKNQYQLRDPSDVFRQVDVDGSGSLDRGELKQLLRKLGQTKIRDEHVTELMGELDTDGDGGVSYEEFEYWWRRNGGKKYKTREQREEEDLALGGGKGIKGKLQRQKSKLIERMTDNADDSAALHRSSKMPNVIVNLQGSDPLASPVSNGSPDRQTFWNPLDDEHGTRTTADADDHDARHSTSAPRAPADVQPSQVFSVRFSEKKPLGLGLAEQFYHDEAGTSHRVVRVVKVAKGQYGAQYSGSGLRKGVIIAHIGGQPAEQLTMPQIYELLKPDHRPTEISFAEFAEIRGANSLTRGDTSDLRAAGAAAAVAHKLGGRFGHRGPAPASARSNGGSRLAPQPSLPPSQLPQPPPMMAGSHQGRPLAPPPQLEVELPLPDQAFDRGRRPTPRMSGTRHGTRMAAPPALDIQQLVRGRSDAL
eukprot:COSAG02_NODE_9817_length_2101_cov_1.282717_1_plen_448_part_00